MFAADSADLSSECDVVPEAHLFDEGALVEGELRDSEDVDRLAGERAVVGLADVVAHEFPGHCHAEACVAHVVVGLDVADLELSAGKRLEEAQQRPAVALGTDDYPVSDGEQNEVPVEEFLDLLQVPVVPDRLYQLGDRLDLGPVGIRSRPGIAEGDRIGRGGLGP
jgi:hypothetical protein